MTIIYLATNQPLDLTRFLMCLAAGLLNSLVGQSVGIAMGLAFEIIVRCAILKLLSLFFTFINYFQKPGCGRDWMFNHGHVCPPRWGINYSKQRPYLDQLDILSR